MDDVLKDMYLEYISESIFFYYDRETIWHGKTGNYKVKEMNDKHLTNLIDYLELKQPDNKILPILHKELELRVGSFKYFDINQ